MGDKVQVIIDRPNDILTVFLCQRGQVDPYTRDIHALPASQSSVVLRLTDQAIRLFLFHTKLQVTIVDQHVIAYRQV